MTIGAQDSGAAAFTGKFDDIRFYDDALTDTELSVLYNAGVAVIPEPSSSMLLGALGALGLLRRRR